MVRLITHNLLACHVRGCTTNNFPLAFKDVEIQLREAEFNQDFLRGFLPKLEWRALVDTAKSLNDQSLPDTPPAPEQMDTEFLKALHHVLLEIHVEEGAMVCANCGHVYPISNGIPNMLLQEHEL
ncbi:related to TRM112-subunit of an adoMet-dependent tRNA methyltransferase (MTase) complex [Serendipita indica DSM 11827]|uniref:Related to TRM112-subunit of an adoMet-dependent tRNA methyltransferase (MTase) complex n=1 Tax=Serendipita indica (strain DSM 11827) TaxID=1109443 RepID=G4TTU2_SERID|nr:related to TRM112-subunit of an adoMet-dependent tRNA methyltransferase (MTase) complex [Serendipita indica DSM 11827]